MEGREIYTAKDAESYKAHAGEKYRPSNGSEGEYFMSSWCQVCHFDRFADKNADRGCKIIVYMMVFNLDDKKYPKELQYGADGQPCCTKFVERGTVKTTRRKGPPSAKNAVKDLFK